MFGQYPFESEPTIAPDGTVQKSNPWLDQLIENMEDLLQLDSAAELLCGFSPNKPLTLFKELSAAFCQVDPTELRVRVLSVRILPPWYAPPALPHPPPVLAIADPVLPTFLCECVLPDGTTCNFIGQDAKRLATHMKKFHSTLFPQGRATVTNVCLWCSRFFRDIKRSTSHPKLHWIVVTVAKLEAHSRSEPSIRHRLWFVRRVLSCPLLCQHFLNAYDLISATLLAQILHPRLHRFRSAFMNAWPLGAPPSQVA